MKKLFFFCALTLLVSSCGTSKKVSVLHVATPLAPDAVVEIIGVGQKVPDGAKLIGQLKIGDAGFTTKCTYADVIADAQNQARGMGGNILQITWHKEPNVLVSTCHRIKADIYLKK